jgi:hypothetical protein
MTHIEINHRDAHEVTPVIHIGGNQQYGIHQVTIRMTGDHTGENAVAPTVEIVTDDGRTLTGRVSRLDLLAEQG